MQRFLRRSLWFALIYTLTVPLAIAPAEAWQGYLDREDRGSYEYHDRQMLGVWTMARSIRDENNDIELRYRLILRRDGMATMVVDRSGFTRRATSLNEGLGSLLNFYLRREHRILHTGTWTSDPEGDHVTVRLSDISGRREVTRFDGTREGRRLRLTTNNTRLYGDSIRFVFHQTDEAPLEHGERPPDRRPSGSNRNTPSTPAPPAPPATEDNASANSGSLVWQGSVDDGAFLYIRQNTVRVETTNDQAVLNSRYEFIQSLPLHQTHVSIVKNSGRGDVTIMEQPTAQNNYTAVLKIADPQTGRSDYKIAVSWE